MKPIFCATSEEARLRASDALQTVLHEKKQSGTPVLLLLSGGLAFSLIEHVPVELWGSHIMVGMLDERYSKDESVNNFAQLTKRTFYADAHAAGVLFADTRLKIGETQNELAVRFEHVLRDWAENHTDGVVIATMGIGADGHTAGIMPFPENPDLFQRMFEDKKNWVVAYDAGAKNPYPLRVTVTCSFLRTRVDYAVVFAVGEEKRVALERVFVEQGSLAETPARVVREMKDVRLFTDF